MAPDRRPPNYLLELLARLAPVGLTPGTVTRVTVPHDDDCPLLAGGRSCTCEPDFRLVTVDPPEDSQSC